MADIAMKYYKEPLLSGTYAAGQVPVPKSCSDSPLDPQLDCNTNLHMNTYTVGLGNVGTIYGVTHNEAADAYATPPAWPNANAARDPRQIDDLYHAAVNGRGEMLNAASAADLGTQLKQAVNNIRSKSGTTAAAAVTSSQLTSGSTVYFANYNSSGWHGTISAFGLTLAGGTFELNEDPDWSAAEELDDVSNLSNRRILTYNSDGVEFEWGNLTADMKSDLNTNASGGTDVTVDLGSGVYSGPGQDRLSYIRGDRSNEGTGSGDLRERTTRLGDIVHSAPVFVGKPNADWPDKFPSPYNPSSPYSAFVDDPNGTGSTRDEIVYVGANDRMLHGFDSSNGEEVLAYITSNLFSSDAGEGLTLPY
jgi:type IV pilus assembly protein PilY1